MFLNKRTNKGIYPAVTESYFDKKISGNVKKLPVYMIYKQVAFPFYIFDT